MSQKQCSLKRQRNAKYAHSLMSLPSGVILEILSFLEPQEILDRPLCKEWETQLGEYWCRVCRKEQTVFPLPRDYGFKVLEWRKEFLFRRRFFHSFRPPFSSRRLQAVESEEEVAYLNLKIFVEQIPQEGIYVDILVGNIRDNISLSLVDFDGEGGCSSLTFSPDTGTVIKERKTSETPRKIVGEYFQCLPVSASLYGENNGGRCGVFISSKRAISFYRKHHSFPTWETTGTVADCTWVTGGIVTPCLAFREAGDYNIKINTVRLGLPIKASCVRTTVSLVSEWKQMRWLDEQEREEDNEW